MASGLVWRELGNLELCLAFLRVQFGTAKHQRAGVGCQQVSSGGTLGRGLCRRCQEGGVCGGSLGVVHSSEKGEAPESWRGWASPPTCSGPESPPPVSSARGQSGTRRIT